LTRRWLQPFQQAEKSTTTKTNGPTMSEILQEIATLLQQAPFNMKGKAGAKHLRGGVCPSCGHKSLWTFAETPWVSKCERLNNCGAEYHAKELFPDLFNSWTERYQVPEEAKPIEQRNPHAAAEAYLKQARGFDLDLIRGTYVQESYYDAKADAGRGAGSSTVRFLVANTWWERIIDKPQRFGKKKANFKYGGTYAGHWWALPGLTFDAPRPDAPDLPTPPKELWLVEGIFDAIALAHHGIAAVALLSCNNYPGEALKALLAHIAVQGGQVAQPTLVWAFDGDKAGRDYTKKFVRRARDAGWVCKAAQIPQRGKEKQDWNDLHQKGALEEQHLKEYLHHGALLIAGSAMDKALLMYNHTSRAEFDLEFGNRLYWFKMDVEKYRKAMDRINDDIDTGYKKPMEDGEKQAEAMKESGGLQEIANCSPRALYYQRNETTQESWYYFRVSFPHDGAVVKGTFTSGQLTAASEFKKQLLGMAPGAMFTGNSIQLERIMKHQLDNPKVVETVDFVGYSATHKTYLLGPVAVHGGQLLEPNAEDYFEVPPRLSIKTLQRSVHMHINTNPDDYQRDWFNHVWTAFGAKGAVALAYWYGSLFAEQVRKDQQSFPFLEIVGEPGSGKTTLIQFMWKLLGRDYEGFDPSKSTSAGRMRTFTQVSNMPIVLIESDRETAGKNPHVRSFDWDELKDAYNGNNIRTTGVKTAGNETYEPPFRASIVISQNNPVQASQAIMERICHMTFDTKGFTTESYESAKALERYDMEAVSGFILAALKREAAALDIITGEMEGMMQFLLNQDGVHKPRLAKNHAQLLAFAKALRLVVRISDVQFEAMQAQIVQMCKERQLSINADHPVVQEFWDTFDYLDAIRPGGSGHPHDPERDTRPALNHSRDKELIAVNLNEYIEKAATHRQQVPMLADLKKYLKTSKTRRFVDVKSVSSAIRFRDHLGDDVPKTMHCWIFQKKGA
jgi:energy-coupling factor transporter ATP-binding protein EcfA2